MISVAYLLVVVGSDSIFMWLRAFFDALAESVFEETEGEEIPCLMSKKIGRLVALGSGLVAQSGIPTN